MSSSLLPRWRRLPSRREAALGGDRGCRELISCLPRWMRSTPACGNAWRGLPTWNISGNPSLGCWTVRRDEAGVWITDYAWPDPEPAPFTTIGWRLLHIADCKVMYHEWAFGPGKL